MRRTQARVRPFRRMVEAVNVVESWSGMPDQHDAGTGPDEVGGAREPVVDAAHLERRVAGAVEGGTADHVLRCQCGRRPGAQGRRAAVGERFDRHDVASGQDRELHQQQPDRPAADHRHRPAVAQVCQVGRVDRHAEWFQQRPGGRVVPVGQQVQPPVRPGQELPQAAVGVTVAGEVHPGAQVLQPGVALAAVAAGQGGIEPDRAAGQRAGDHDAGHLVAEHQRSGDRGVADRARGEPVQVGAAQSDGRHADEALPGPDDRVGPLLDADVAGRVEDGATHDRTGSAVSPRRPRRPGRPAAVCRPPGGG